MIQMQGSIMENHFTIIVNDVNFILLTIVKFERLKPVVQRYNFTVRFNEVNWVFGALEVLLNLIFSKFKVYTNRF